MGFDVKVWPETDSWEQPNYAEMGELLKDEDPYIRRAVARNPSLPRENLEELAKDKVLIVAREAKGVLDSPDVKIDETYPTQHGG